MAIALETSQSIAFGTGTNVSTSITVDAAADCVLVFWQAWDARSSNQISDCTLGGTQPDYEYHPYPAGDGNSTQTYCGVWYNPTSGSQTLAFTNASSSDGPCVHVVQLSGVDTTSAPRDTDAQGYPHGDSSAGTANSITLTTVADDWVLHCDYGYGNGTNLPGTQSGWTSIQYQVNNGGHMRTTRLEATGTSVTANGQDENYSTSFGIVLIPAAGGTDTEVNASVDSLTLTERQASVAIDVAITTSLRALTLTENAATIGYGVNVSTAVDALTLTENAATVTYDVDVLAGVDALTLSNLAAAIAVDINVLASAVALSLTENQSAVVYDVGVNAGTDALLLTTLPAALGGDTIVSAGVDSLSLAEQQATVSYDVEISAGVDSLALTEQQSIISVDVEVISSVDGLTLTEHQASVLFVGDVNIDAALVALVLTEHRAGIDGSFLVTDTPTGGWLNDYSAYRQRAKARDRRRKEILDQIRELDGIDGEIARMLHADDERQDENDRIDEFRSLLDKEISKAKLDKAGLLNKRINRAYDRAMKKATFSAVQALEREIEDAIEEEDFLFIVMTLQ